MIARIGSEQELIQTYLAPLASKMPGALRLVDDCALLVPPPGSSLAVSTDAVAAGVHFFPDDDAADIAWKALAVNVSDLIATGASPYGYQMALSFPEAPTHDWMAKFAAGLAEAQAAFGIGLTGGDTDRRPGPVTVTITALGTLPKGASVLRSGAQPGDILYVTGTLGDSALGLKLRQDQKMAAQLGLHEQGESHALRRYLRPDPPLKIIDALRSYASAAIDVSDGLLKDLGRLARASHVGAIIERARLPLSEGCRLALGSDASLADLPLNGGDDYEVLCAIPPDKCPSFEQASGAAGVSVTQIGNIGDFSGVRVQEASGSVTIAHEAGWDHF